MDEPSRIFNVDETGVQIVTQGGKVLVKKGYRMCKFWLVQKEDRIRPLLHVANASGNFIPPMVIFKGSRKPSEDSLGQLPPGTLAEVSKSVWIDKDLLLA